MLRVLVVDDEPRQRKILSNLIRDYRGEYEVLEAKNGEEALELCKERTMDIVFSDIRMPKLDGLSLVERICSQNPHAKIVVISGYSDFSYARRALDLRVHSYILKPIESDRILESLRQMEEEIRMDRSSKREMEAMAEQLHSLLPYYSDHLMNKWLKGECTRSESEEVESLLQNRGQGCVVLAQFNRPVTDNASVPYTAEDWNEIRGNIRAWISETLNPYGHSVSFYLHRAMDTIASVFFASSEFESCSGSWHCELRRLADSLLREYGIAMTIGIGQAQSDIFSAAETAFATAEVALRCRFYLCEAKIICFDDIRNRYTEEPRGTYSFEAEFKPVIHGLKPLNDADLDEGAERLMGDQYPDPALLLDYVSRNLLQLLHGIRNIVPEEEIGRLAQQIKSRVQPVSCSDLVQLKRQWGELLKEMASAVQAQKDNKNYIVMERCLTYIHQHLGEEISLEELAKKYYFNSSYFSTLFKKYTGKHFTEYVIDLRIESAFRILLGSDKKIYEVAQEVGYRDVKYFNKIFKKHYGLTPEECRVFSGGRE